MIKSKIRQKLLDSLLEQFELLTNTLKTQSEPEQLVQISREIRELADMIFSITANYEIS